MSAWLQNALGNCRACQHVSPKTFVPQPDVVSVTIHWPLAASCTPLKHTLPEKASGQRGKGFGLNRRINP